MAKGVPLLIALLLALVGVLIAWRWELTGGVVAVAGALTIMGLVCLDSGGDMLLCAVSFSFPLLVAGVLHLGSATTRLVQLGASPSPVKAGIAQPPKRFARRSATSAP